MKNNYLQKEYLYYNYKSIRKTILEYRKVILFIIHVYYISILSENKYILNITFHHI